MILDMLSCLKLVFSTYKRTQLQEGPAARCGCFWESKFRLTRHLGGRRNMFNKLQKLNRQNQSRIREVYGQGHKVYEIWWNPLSTWEYRRCILNAEWNKPHVRYNRLQTLETYFTKYQQTTVSAVAFTLSLTLWLPFTHLFIRTHLNGMLQYTFRKGLERCCCIVLGNWL